MDLRLFHHKHRPNAYYGFMDRNNSRTGSICYYYELKGWYNLNLAMRLLGHYRLFNLCKARQVFSYSGLSPEFGYILHYRENNILKNTWVELIPFVTYSIRQNKHPEIDSINQIFLFKRPEILQNFLIAAQADFDKALIDAMAQISDPSFLSEAPLTNFHLEITENHQHNTTLAKSELHIHPYIKEEAAPAKPAKGKEEGVFSKKQILTILDLLAASKAIEPIDFEKTNKFPAIAQLLHALTRHGEESWRDELNDYRTKSLYTWDPNHDGQRMELIRIFSNLAEKLHNAGFKKIAKLADQKIRELERAAP